jgi:hypothetical protein
MLSQAGPHIGLLRKREKLWRPGKRVSDNIVFASDVADVAGIFSDVGQLAALPRRPRI